jgi:hypothetical protein
MDKNNIRQTVNLVSSFRFLKNQYPDCIWLKECLKINQGPNETLPAKSVRKISSDDLSISQN